MKVRSEKTKQDFIKYLEEHPHQRFWQAVRNWSGYAFVLASATPPDKNELDTYYLEGKNHTEREKRRDARKS